jgi:serpin B
MTLKTYVGKMKKKSIFLLFVVYAAFFSNAWANEKSLAYTCNNFGINLYQKISAEAGDKNVFISPYSIYSALSITYAGTNNTTKLEFEKSLGIENPTIFYEALSKTIESLNARNGKEFSLLTANALWIDQRATLLKNYKELTKKYFGTSENSVDFTNPEKSAETINNWVEKQTKDNIHRLISPNSIAPDTNLIITNAIYFKAEWLNAFKHESTMERDFNPFSNVPLKTQMMRQQNYFKYLAMDGSTFIELPYKDKQLSMIVILPEEHGANALANAESKLSSNLDKFLSADAGKDSVILTLPKLKIETPLLVLNNTLQKLGIIDAFTPSKADFSGIDGTHNLYINLVAHKAMINVDEQGTEAAAATAVIMAPTSALIPNKPKEFNADRPFIYLIRDNETGLILFIGKFLTPLQN